MNPNVGARARASKSNISQSQNDGMSKFILWLWFEGEVRLTPCPTKDKGSSEGTRKTAACSLLARSSAHSFGHLSVCLSVCLLAYKSWKAIQRIAHRINNSERSFIINDENEKKKPATKLKCATGGRYASIGRFDYSVVFANVLL